jgi:shikimate dehydrogenase
MSISTGTRLVALLGHPVAHSLSPRMQNAAFAARGLDWAYVALEVPPERLEEAVRGLDALGFAGANVTAPHKQAVARIVGTELPSVNTLVGLQGFSTDAAILEQVTDCYKPVIVGDGGAAAAFRAALPEARVFARKGEWPPAVSDADLVVNATPVRDQVLVELRPGQTLVDLPYPRSATAEAAAAAGATVFDGLDVLVAQGAASFQLWTGVPAPVDVMRRALGLPA